ncbi:MAG TPA: DinB family protein [Acidimicrobiales bacterium]|nr:DinB family protein [Acidimicrobiales bacterium]
MAIVPDTKDWTWVLDRRCEECGFDASTLPAGEVARLIDENVAVWRPLLTGPDGAMVARRPASDRWSALEYACHVRDVLRLYDERLALMLAEHDPAFPNWDQDAAAVDERYAEQDPATVAGDIEEAGARLAAHFAGVQGDAWARTGTRSDGAHFTIDTFGRYLVHDPIHHVHDVEQGYARLGVDRPPA